MHHLIIKTLFIIHLPWNILLINRYYSLQSLFLPLLLQDFIYFPVTVFPWCYQFLRSVYPIVPPPTTRESIGVMVLRADQVCMDFSVPYMRAHNGTCTRIHTPSLTDTPRHAYMNGKCKVLGPTKKRKCILFETISSSRFGKPFPLEMYS